MVITFFNRTHVDISLVIVVDGGFSFQKNSNIIIDRDDGIDVIDNVMLNYPTIHPCGTFVRDLVITWPTVGDLVISF